MGTLDLHTPDSVLLSVKCRIPGGWKPGQHAFLAIPAISGFPLESHPFTIASIPNEDGPMTVQELTFIIQRRNGLTKRLVNHARAGESQIPVFIDGPYGQPPDLAPYKTCILVAGMDTFSAPRYSYRDQFNRWFGCIVHSSFVLGYRQVTITLNLTL
jgi:ferric-chelate reductase